MNAELIAYLSQITPEEQELLDGRTEIARERYTNGHTFTVTRDYMIRRGRLLDIRTHTRFVAFPQHNHDYIEIMYVCEGEITHIVNDTDRVVLRKGELLFLNQHARHEILPASRGDIGVNFMVMPEFFDTALGMLDGENALREFLVSALRTDSSAAQYLHFKVADVVPVQNLVENLVWSVVHTQGNRRKINETTMGLLFLQLLNCTERIEQSSVNAYDRALTMAVLRYIEERYRDASLTELAETLHQSIYKLSRHIKHSTGSTFKELLQAKRFHKASELLCSTQLPVSDIILAVGYDNSSYFHRQFQQKYGVSPKEYRQQHSGKK